MDAASAFLTHLLAFLFLTLAMMVAAVSGLQAGRGDIAYARTGTCFAIFCGAAAFVLQVLA